MAFAYNNGHMECVVLHLEKYHTIRYYKLFYPLGLLLLLKVAISATYQSCFRFKQGTLQIGFIIVTRRYGFCLNQLYRLLRVKNYLHRAECTTKQAGEIVRSMSFRLFEKLPRNHFVFFEFSLDIYLKLTLFRSPSKPVLFLRQLKSHVIL